MSEPDAGPRVRGVTLRTDWEALVERIGPAREVALRDALDPRWRALLPPARVERWAPAAALCDLTRAAAALLDEAPEATSRALGRANADRYDRPLVRYLIRLGPVERGFRNPGLFWNVHYDRGTLSLELDEPGRKRLRLDDFIPPAPFWCERVVGFAQRLLELARHEVTTAEHPECAARGAPCCRYEFRYFRAAWP